MSQSEKEESGAESGSGEGSGSGSGSGGDDSDNETLINKVAGVSHIRQRQQSTAAAVQRISLLARPLLHAALALYICCCALDCLLRF